MLLLQGLRDPRGRQLTEFERAGRGRYRVIVRNREQGWPGGSAKNNNETVYGFEEVVKRLLISTNCHFKCDLGDLDDSSHDSSDDIRRPLVDVRTTSFDASFEIGEVSVFGSRGPIFEDFGDSHV